MEGMALLLPNILPFEHHIRDLCERLANCEDDALSLKLAGELQVALHDEIERLREKVAGMHVLHKNKKQSPA